MGGVLNNLWTYLKTKYTDFGKECGSTHLPTVEDLYLTKASVC